MKKLVLDDILSNEDYAKIRDDFRKRVMAIKDARRVTVGPYFTFLFENRDTMHYQVQEMSRAEGLRTPEAVEHEMKTYNQFIPEAGELVATLLIEIDDPRARDFKLVELRGIEDHVFLVVGGHEIKATFDEEQISERRVSSVQYIRFALSDAALAAFQENKDVELRMTHPAYGYRMTLPEDKRAALLDDLRAGVAVAD